MALALSCRFVPYDQWFATHVDPGWHVKDAKLWFLQKCLHDIALIDPPRRRTSRTPSPIVFASDSKNRPVSPILFASPDLSSDHSEHEPQPLPDDNKERSQPTRPELPASLLSVYDPDKLSLIRFSTGQVLEDDFLLEWYDIKPYELLEVHRSGIVLCLPRNSISDYIQPYWEGWVKALRVVLKPSAPSDPLSGTRIRTGDKHAGSRVTAQHEWKKRWAVIHRGVLCLCKDRKDANPSQLLDLSSLAAIRDAEHLRRSTAIVPTADQRIICAKFLTKPKTMSSVPADDVPKTTTTTTIIASNLPSSSRKPKAKLKIKPPLSLPLSKRRVYHPGPGSRSGSGNTSTATIAKTDSPTRGETRLKGKETIVAVDHESDEDCLDPDLEPDVTSRSQEVHSDVESPVGSDASSNLSSPVFAHMVDGYGSGDPVFSSEDESYRPSYTYGYRFDTSVAAKCREKKSDPDREVSPQDKQAAGASSSSENQPRRKDHGEWVVLDMGDENAFSSILRVLHRHCTHSLTSTFTALLPSVAGAPLSFPLEDDTGASSEMNDMHSQPAEVPTPTPQLNRLPSSLLQTNFTSKSRHNQLPISLSVAHKLSATFGALPYPEWRTHVTKRARRAGIGKISTAMEMILFGTTIPLQPPRGRPRRNNTEEAAESPSSQRSVSTAADSDSGEESSEVEWLGWLGDLPRQQQVSKQRRIRDEMIHDLRNESEARPLNLLSETQLEDQRRFLEDRRAFEPSAVVTSMSKHPIAHPPTPQPSPSSPHFADPFDEPPSPVDMPSTSTSPAHSRTHSRLDDWTGPLESNLLPFRRPSMPTIMDNGNSGLSSYSVASATGSGSKSSSQPRATILTRSASGRSLNSNSVRPVAVLPTITGTNTVPRRASMSGLIGPSIGGSIGKTRSPAVLKKDNENRQKQESNGELASRRPRLSVSTSSPAHPSLGSSRATSPTFVARSIIRPVQSNLSLRSGNESEDREASQLKKKKGGLVRGVSEKLVRGLDSALDFVDGR